MNEVLLNYPVVIQIPIAWGDMDAFQHVNNVMYLRYFESARIAYFDKIGFMETMDRTGIGPILASTQCKYKIPLTFPDLISVGAKVDSIHSDRFIMNYAVISHQYKKIAATGEATIVTFDYIKKNKAPVPDEITEKIVALEKNVIIDTKE